MRIGVIDVGTNAIHLVVAERTGRQVRMLKHEQALVRLGDGGLVRNRLTMAAQSRALAVLQRYAKRLARDRVARIDAVATSAVRDASNGRAFVRVVRRRCGIPLRIISGEEEARLIFRGAMFLNRFRGQALMVTIGGGSAQVMCGSARRLAAASSVPLGSSRLTQRFLAHDPAQAEDVEALARHVRQRWAGLRRSPCRRRWREALGSSGLIRQVIIAVRRSSDRPMTHASLQRFSAWLSRSTAAQRRRIPGIDPRRQDLLLATSVTLLAWMQRWGVGRLRFAPGSLREGLLIR
ncbi:MAG: hypothetical protein HY737_09110 [Candidatus Omnitrophica bacterium]|nr:hypothetical protein [Candidatus Omnitrophota bacterium]